MTVLNDEQVKDVHTTMISEVQFELTASDERNKKIQPQRSAILFRSCLARRLRDLFGVQESERQSAIG